jgi:hypothetical protein
MVNENNSKNNLNKNDKNKNKNDKNGIKIETENERRERYNRELQKDIESFKMVSGKILEIDKKIRAIDPKILIKPNFREYPSPTFKKTENAYVTLLINNEDYLPTVLVQGYTFRKFNHKYNLICMVQDKPVKKLINNVMTDFPGVSKKGIDEILKIYDKVIGVDLLQLIPPKNPEHFSQKTKHYKNISIYVTKTQVMGLIEYKQVLYLDASVIVHKNIDYFFKEYPDNHYLWDSAVIKGGTGILGSVFIYKPDPIYYTKGLFLMQHFHKIFGDLFFTRGIDETILFFTIYPNWSNMLIKKWTRCTEVFAFRHCDLYQYQTIKPFKKPENSFNETKITFKIWDRFAKELLQKYPEYKSYFNHIKDFRPVNY